MGNLGEDDAPQADFVMAEDLYSEIDAVSSRITALQRAVAVRGVYDRANDGIKQLLDSQGRAGHNQLIPVDGWGGLAEKGGLKGAVDWLPLEMVMDALTALRDYRVELIDALHQVTGMSDIMRGQASTPDVTATEQDIKARFGSVRVQAQQDEFARFASEVQGLKAEVMARFFLPETYLAQSNILATDDAPLAQQAVELLKSDAAQWRIEVKPEAVALTDFAANKSEALEVVQSLSGYVSAVAPLITQMPQVLPFLLEMLQWAMARLRGASTIEGVLDRAIQQAKQMPPQAQQQGQQDQGKLLAQQMKGQQDLAKVKAELDADIVRTQVEVEAEAKKEENQANWNVREQAAKARIGAMMRPQRSPNGRPPR